MIHVKVIAEDGWQNGDSIHPKGKVLELDCDQKRIQPYIDSNSIELVKPTKKEEDELDIVSQTKNIAKLAAKTAAETLLKAYPPQVPIKVTDRSDNDPHGGFKSMAEFAHSVYMADNHNHESHQEVKKLREWDAKAPTVLKTAGHMAEGDETQGGHLVPTGFIASLLQTSIESAIVRPRATFVPMQTNSIGFPALADYSHAHGTGTIFGGIKIYRPGEGAQKTATKPEFGKVTLTLHKYACLTYVSDELLEDSPISVEPLLNTLFGKAIAWQEDNDFINGTGVNMPMGVMASACLISIARDPAAGTLSYADVCNMWSRLHPSCMGNAIWLVNNDLLPFLYQICLICTGSDGSDLCGAPMYVPGNGAAEAPYGTLFGRPVIVTEHCQTAGTSGDIILCDWSQYLIGGKTSGGTPKLDTSIHIRFDYDETAFRAVLRNDGQPWWASALTPKHGTNTLSPFVVLNDNAQ